ncbi:MAG: restriction endonuclease subunit S [Fibrobacter sp.]|nr:restriction endonuclease subunit S [Fibrobacter sp.]MDD5942535.1 restriction endonuclease subunit S [Fibrobacter sp.]
MPENWEWVRLGDVASDFQYGSAEKSQVEGKVAVLRMGNINRQGQIDYGDLFYTSNDAEIAKYLLNKNDVLFNRTNSPEWVGKTAIYKGEIPAIYAGYIIRIRPHFNSDYLNYLMCSDYERNWSKEVKTDGVHQSNINAQKLITFAIPLPPIAEQRIVAKIEEAFAEIDAIEKNKELLKTHIKQTRQKILDLAIHGKLVPQNKSDEPASVLLERITRDNPHYEKLTDVPFEIPGFWAWVKLGDVCKPIKRGKSPKYIEQSNVLVFAQKCNQKDGPVSLEKALYLDESTLNKYPKEEFLQKGDVVINSTGTGTLGRVGYFNVDLPHNIKGIVPDSHVTTIRSVYVNPYYLYCFLKNKQTYLEENGEGSTNQKELKPHTIYDLEFPLPPLAEQKRIVNKIDEIFASLDEISLHLV